MDSQIEGITKFLKFQSLQQNFRDFGPYSFHSLLDVLKNKKL